MKRPILVALLVASFGSIASAQFAQPPPHPARLEPWQDFVTVRAALARARAANLEAFRAYVKRGTYPSNTFQGRRLNVWRDADGHLCAAATIIDASGQHELVNHVAETMNFIKLADVSDGPLMSWILESGFTQAEIAAIQEPFSPVTNTQRRVDPDLRTAEDARLRARYAEVDRELVRDQQASLDRAAALVMANPDLARALVSG